MDDFEWSGMNIPRDGDFPEECTRAQGVRAVGEKPAKRWNGASRQV